MGPLTASHRSYTLVATPVRQTDGRWSVAVEISRESNGVTTGDRFMADDGIAYLLEIEASREGLNLGRNLIDRGIVGF